MNWNILGHDWAVQLLRGHISQNRLKHAYLITGPRGIGRRTLALRFSQALNCPESIELGLPCQRCKTCIQIEHGTYPDLAVVLPDEPGSPIKVDQIRDLQRSLALAPYAAKFRIALLPQFELSTESAANALLKTLEEPPTQVMMLLTSETTDTLLPTIVSRCEIIRLRPVPLKKVERGLIEMWDLPQKQAALLAQLSGGRPGIAHAFHHDSNLLLHRQSFLEEHFRVLKSDRVERFAFAEQLSKDKLEFQAAIEVWLSFWRDVLLFISRAEIPLANPDREKEIHNVASRMSLSGARQIIEDLEHTLQLVDSNVNPRLAAEVLLMDLPDF